MAEWTTIKLLTWMEQYFKDKGIDSPQLSAQLLLSHVLNKTRLELYLNHEKPVPQEKLDQLRALVKQAGQHKPIAYLTGSTCFYSMDFIVDTNTLIPRPETEMLVEKAVDFLRTRQGQQYALDLCTGSGCIACAVAKNFKDVKLIATDICEDALNIADKNVNLHKLNDKIHLLQGSLFEPVIEQLDESRFDLIISNPPYVSESEYQELDANVKDYEPSKALLAGVDGLDIYKSIAELVGSFLKDDGLLLMEIGYRQGSSVKEILQDTGLFELIRVEKDFNDNDRVVSAYRKIPAGSISQEEKSLL